MFVCICMFLHMYINEACRRLAATPLSVFQINILFVYIYTYIDSCIHLHIYIYIYICMGTCTCMYIRILIYMLMYLCISVYQRVVWGTHSNAAVGVSGSCADAYIYIHIDPCIYTCMYIYISMYGIYIFCYIYTHMNEACKALGAMLLFLFQVLFFVCVLGSPSASWCPLASSTCGLLCHGVLDVF